jgi:hypothetical protein
MSSMLSRGGIGSGGSPCGELHVSVLSRPERNACVGEEIIFRRMRSKAVSMRYHQRICCDSDQGSHLMLATKIFGDDDAVDFRSVIFFMAEFDIRQSRSATCRGTQRSRQPLDKGAGQLCKGISSRTKKVTFARHQAC